MGLTETIKCIFCLAKCSKILYFIKKTLCFVSIAIVGIFLICTLKDNKDLMKKFRVM